jgi:hypothetical protein
MCSAPLMLSDWQLGSRPVDTSDQCLVHLPGYYCTELPKAYNDEWDLMSVLRSRRSGPTPRGLFYYQHLFFAGVTSYGHGCKGARHQRLQLRWWPLPDLPTAPQEAHHRRLQLQWWPLSDLPASPQGARHRRLQLRWWPLPNLPAAPPRGPAIDVTNSGGGRCWTCRQHPQGGPPSTSPTCYLPLEFFWRHLPGRPPR